MGKAIQHQTPAVGLKSATIEEIMEVASSKNMGTRGEPADDAPSSSADSSARHIPCSAMPATAGTGVASR